MKKTLAIILTAIMVLSMVITAIPFAASADETTTVLDPKNAANLSIGKVAEGYTTDLVGATAIGTAAELKAALAGAGTNYGSYYLTADIDLTGTDYMPAFGVFEGNFDGCGYTITTKTPIFYGIGSGDTDLVANNCATSVIKNLNIVADIDVATYPELPKYVNDKGEELDVGYSVGALAFFACPAKDKVLEYTNIRVTGTVKGDDKIDRTENEDEACTGGLVGAGYGGFKMSYVFIDDMTITGACAGGVYGSASIGSGRAGQLFSVENCYVNADITQAGSNGNADGGGDRIAAAGLFAYVQHSNITIKNVEIYGTITAENSVYVAGIIGRSAMAGNATGAVVIEDCKVYADIVEKTFSKSSWAGVGGILGIPQFQGENLEAGTYVLVKNCVNYGNITANCNVGGIVGASVNGITRIIGCKNYGTIKSCEGYTETLEDRVYAGGLVGRAGKAVVIGGLDPTTGADSDAVSANYGVVSMPNVNKANVGGIVGGVTGTGVVLANCVNEAALSGYVAGGIVGYLKNAAELKNCDNSGAVTAGDVAGGLVAISGTNDYVIDENCSNTGALSGTVSNDKVAEEPEITTTAEVTTTETPVDTTTEAPADTTTAAPVDTTTVAPVDNTTAAPVDNTTEAPTTEAPKSNGCGGFSAVAAIFAVICGAAVVVIKKRA